jgi:protein-disulfide isomerase
MTKSQFLQNAATGILVLCAVVVTGLLVRREFFTSAPDTAGPAPVRRVEGWREFSAGGNRAGPADARVTVVEFADFQCPFCQAVARRLDSLRQERPQDLAFVYRHFPLANHVHAVAAARASECAGAQGRFWPMHDVLYERQESIGALPWARYGAEAGVPDSAAFARCMARTDEVPGLQRDVEAGHRLKVRGTPTILINNYRVEGAPPMDTLRAYVRRALEESATR